MNSLKPVKQKEDWLTRKWRPMMAVTYMAICIFDFIVGPILNYMFFSKTGADFNAWKPLTMSDGGLFHISMGAILGLAAWTRGQEKVRRIESPYSNVGAYDETRNYRSRQDQDVID